MADDIKKLLLVLLIISFFIGAMFSYFTPVYYEARYYPWKHTDSAGYYIDPAYLKVRYETRRSFLPNERIKVTAYLMITDTIYQKSVKFREGDLGYQKLYLFLSLI